MKDHRYRPDKLDLTADRILEIIATVLLILILIDLGTGIFQ